MKRVWSVILIALVLLGCKQENRGLEQGIQFRSELLRAKECRFISEIVADYGEEVHSFLLENVVDSHGRVSFCVLEPDSIAGIQGEILNSEGKIIFDNTILAFPLLTDDKLSPISASWILMKSLRSGYISSSCMDGDLLRLTINDSFEEDALMLDVWLSQNNEPVHAEILHKGERILTVEISDFRIL